MLFDKNVERCCSWCKFGSRISPTEAACLKRGIVSAGGCCRCFKYDPLKREPPVPAVPVGDKYESEDFSIGP